MIRAGALALAWTLMAYAIGVAIWSGVNLAVDWASGSVGQLDHAIEYFIGASVWALVGAAPIALIALIGTFAWLVLRHRGRRFEGQRAILVPCVVFGTGVAGVLTWLDASSTAEAAVVFSASFLATVIGVWLSAAALKLIQPVRRAS